MISVQWQLVSVRAKYFSVLLDINRRDVIIDNTHQVLRRRVLSLVCRWHLWRRKYALYINKSQFAAIDGGLLAWEFVMRDSDGGVLALIDRNFQVRIYICRESRRVPTRTHFAILVILDSHVSIAPCMSVSSAGDKSQVPCLQRRPRLVDWSDKSCPSASIVAALTASNLQPECSCVTVVDSQRSPGPLRSSGFQPVAHSYGIKMLGAMLQRCRVSILKTV